ncbi:MAG: hypothetical protein M1829_003847 [Trizodia sp. TS-e1964]|nr:MAG: hypothetical protein M1829_003847 [Trizodia sp. TS-e1964]
MLAIPRLLALSASILSVLAAPALDHYTTNSLTDTALHEGFRQVRLSIASNVPSPPPGTNQPAPLYYALFSYLKQGPDVGFIVVPVPPEGMPAAQAGKLNAFDYPQYQDPQTRVVKLKYNGMGSLAQLGSLDLVGLKAEGWLKDYTVFTDLASSVELKNVGGGPMGETLYTEVLSQLDGKDGWVDLGRGAPRFSF